MTDPQTPSPQWWSQPTPTAALPEPVLAAPVQTAPTRPRRPVRRGSLLLALALVAAGGTGGAVVAAVDHASGTTQAAISTTTTSSTSTVSRPTGSVPGTPEDAAAVIGPSVVTIEVTGTSDTSSGGAFGSPSQRVSDTGSGIVLNTDGYVLTNNHVVAAAEGGGSVHVTLRDGTTVAATIVGHDTTDDLAVVKLSGARNLVAATFADSESLKVGQTVLAVGAPLGLSNTITQGIVSTLHRPVATGESGASSQSVIDAVQTDAAINPGNSGGALVDLAGHVVGINSAIATTGSSGSGQSGSIGVGFAIPANDAVRVAKQLIASGHATHAQIGVSAGNAASTTDGAPGLGATVRSVSAAGPAAAAGLKPGDLITQVDRRRVTDANSLIVAVRSHDPGSKATVTYVRDGRTVAVTVTLAGATSD